MGRMMALVVVVGWAAGCAPAVDVDECRESGPVVVITSPEPLDERLASASVVVEAVIHAASDVVVWVEWAGAEIATCDDMDPDTGAVRCTGGPTGAEGIVTWTVVAVDEAGCEGRDYVGVDLL